MTLFDPTSRKIISREDMAPLLDGHRSKGEKIVFTNGCFDVLHAGHIQYLEQARALGDVLVIGLNSDASVRRLKGPSRPLVPQNDRARILAALEAVSYVMIFEEDTPAETLGLLRPDIHVKGGDYSGDDLPEGEIVRAYGGTVKVLEFLQGRSTTALVKKIRRGPLND
jgi:D-beta-D-heptose 7-phosphate kinase/D-beta-D-heptose 1-phosphate adenosyltransferase